MINRNSFLRGLLTIKLAVALGLALFLLAGGAGWSVYVGKPTGILFGTLIAANVLIVLGGLREHREATAASREGKKNQTA